MAPDTSNKLLEILERYPQTEDALIMVLQDIQREYNYLPADAIRAVAARLSLPLAKVVSVTTFYKAFSLNPRGKNIIKVCKGTTCHVRGAQLIEDELSRLLKIVAGQTTSDFGFTLEIVNCVGACAMAPVVVFNDKFIGDLSPDKVADILEKKNEV